MTAPACTYVAATGDTPCGKPAARELDGRALCDEHIVVVLEQRTAKARRRAGLPRSSSDR